MHKDALGDLLQSPRFVELTISWALVCKLEHARAAGTTAFYSLIHRDTKIHPIEFASILLVQGRFHIPMSLIPLYIDINRL
jgi:hypothetical protein